MGKEKVSNKNRKSRVLVVDDHPIVARGLAALLDSEPDMEVCGEAGGMNEALALVERKKPDLAIIDISLKQGNGIELVKEIKSRRLKTKMLVFSMHDESLYAERVLRAGAMGYIMKCESTENLLQAVRAVLMDRIALSARMSDRLLKELQTTRDRWTGSLAKLTECRIEASGDDWPIRPYGKHEYDRTTRRDS